METAETLSLLGVTHHLSRTLCSEFTKFPIQDFATPSSAPGTRELCKPSADALTALCSQ